jgi:ABC-type branched-subunit amino acid transport system ATPase component
MLLAQNPKLLLVDEPAAGMTDEETAKTGELLKILGYRMRGACGSDVVLETVNASRAFLTIDSGFPIADLEQEAAAVPDHTDVG